MEIRWIADINLYTAVTNLIYTSVVRIFVKNFYSPAK